MSSESVCQVTRSWVDVGSFHTRLVVRFVTLTASVRYSLDTPSYRLPYIASPRADTTNITVTWDVMACSLEHGQKRWAGTRCFHLRETTLNTERSTAVCRKIL
jgi:hypothetical protein